MTYACQKKEKWGMLNDLFYMFTRNILVIYKFTANDDEYSNYELILQGCNIIP